MTQTFNETFKSLIHICTPYKFLCVIYIIVINIFVEPDTFQFHYIMLVLTNSDVKPPVLNPPGMFFKYWVIDIASRVSPEYNVSNHTNLHISSFEYVSMMYIHIRWSNWIVYLKFIQHCEIPSVYFWKKKKNRDVTQVVLSVQLISIWKSHSELYVSHVYIRRNGYRIWKTKHKSYFVFFITIFKLIWNKTFKLFLIITIYKWNKVIYIFK